MNWLQKIARPLGSFLGNEVIVFRGIGLDRAEDALMNGFKDNQFFTTTEERAVFYARFNDSYPGAIFECLIDSSQSNTDINDSTMEQSQEITDAISGAAYEISELLSGSDIEIPSYDLQNFIGNQMASDFGYYDIQYDNPSLWMFVASQYEINPSEVKNIVSPGLYGDWITLDDRGVFGIDADVSSQQLQYSSFVGPENIKAVYLHSSLLSSLGWDWNNTNTIYDNVSIIPGSIEDILYELEKQYKPCDGDSYDEDLCGYIYDLISEISDNTSYEQMTGSITIPGVVFRKLRSEEPLIVSDFEDIEQSKFVRLELPENRMRVLYAIRKGKIRN